MISMEPVIYWVTSFLADARHIDFKAFVDSHALLLSWENCRFV